MTRSRKRKLKRARALMTTVPLASSILAYMPVALAQQEAGGLEEILVTAQKRTENLQDVPLSITALGTEQLEAYNVGNFTDYVKFLPSVAYTTLGPGFSAVYMRGVASGENNNHSGPRPSVGVYLDEQPITTIQGALDLHVYDIARVEALAGPQGTLYGASSQAGTLRIITNKPDPDGFKAGYDLEGNLIDGGDGGGVIEGFTNIPVTQNVAIRMVGWYEHDGGYIDNVFRQRTFPSTGRTVDNANLVENNFNDVDIYGGRAALRIDLNDNWTVTPAVMAQQTKQDGIFAWDRTVGEKDVSHRFPESTDDAFLQAALTVQGKISNFDVVYAGAHLNRSDNVFSDYTDYSYFYDVNYFGTGSCFSCYFYDDAGALIDPSQHIIGKDKYDNWSHELRVSSPADYWVRGVAGLFYQRQEHHIEQRYLIDGLATVSSVTGWGDTFWLTEQERVDRDSAAFGEIYVDVTDKLTLTGGSRYYEARNTLRGFFGFGLTNPYGSSTGEASCFSPEQVNGGPCLNLDKEVKEQGFTWKANATYKFTPDIMAYFNFAQGFRPGGINRRGTLPPYKSDFLTSYEVGWKTAWAGDTLRFNGAFFYSNWDDIQFSYLGLNSLTEIKNANKARIMGVETSVDWVPTDRLTLSGGLSFVDAELSENYCGTVLPNGDPVTNCAAPLAPKGSSLPVTPDFKMNATARYTFDFAGFDSFVQGSLLYQTGAWADLQLADRADHGEQDDYAAVDLSAGMAKGNYHFEIYLDNAFDELGDSYRYDPCSQCGPETYSIPIQPRTVGIKFGQKF